MADGALSTAPAAASPLSTANVHPDAVGTLTGHPCRDKRRWKHVTASERPFFVQLHVLMQAGGSDHILSCDVLGPPTPLLSCLSSHVWPKSLSDRALSYTEMGSSLFVSCQRAHAGGRGHPGSGAHPTWGTALA